MNPENSGSKLNIAMVCDPITDCIGGSFVSTLRFADLLAKKGHKIIFIASRSPQNHDDNFYNDIKIYRFFSLLLPKTENQFYISFPDYRKVKKILKDEKIDILHAIIPTPSAIVSIKAAKALGIKVVAHSHTQPENIFLHFPRINLMEKINDLFYKYLIWIYKQADIIIYPTEFARALFQKFNMDVKTTVISNGVDRKEYAVQPVGDFFNRFSLNPAAPSALFIGRLHPEKSVDTLINAAAIVVQKHPSFCLYIVGFGHLEDKLKAQAAQIGLENQVKFFGKLSDSDKIIALSACDVFVMPSLAELEGMAVLEAMSVGKPIIVSDAPNTAAKYFVKDNGFLFKAEDAGDLAQKIVVLISDQNLKKKMGQNSLALSRQYDIQESVQRLEAVYYGLLN